MGGGGGGSSSCSSSEAERERNIIEEWDEMIRMRRYDDMNECDWLHGVKSFKGAGSSSS